MTITPFSMRITSLLAATVFASQLALAQIGTTVSKSCGACGMPVSSEAQVGDVCPYCKARWGSENKSSGVEHGARPPLDSLLQDIETTRRNIARLDEMDRERFIPVWAETDQVAIARTAQHSPFLLRLAALGRLQDEAVLRKLATGKAEAPEIRVIAIWRLRGQVAIEEDAPIEVRQAVSNSAAMKNKVFNLGDGVVLEMALVQPGEFMMGSAADIRNESPAHRVKITKAFYMARYEITKEQWFKVMGGSTSAWKAPRFPVTNVSWQDCQSFLQKLNDRAEEGRFELPTEAQWEYACRAGSVTEYSWGDAGWGCREWYMWWWSSGAGGLAHPVGERKPNAWGLYDMHGNVCEWCQDWFDSYQAGEVADPKGPPSGADRVLRGGSWNSHAMACRSASRHHVSPEHRREDIGLRVIWVGPENSGKLLGAANKVPEDTARKLADPQH